MTNIITLEKTILLDNIKELINVSVDEDVSYLKRCEGVSCVGQVTINGVYENQNGIEKNFNELIEIDNVIPYENISSLDDFGITVDDFEYALNDEKLKMFIKLKINSFKDVDTSFLAQDVEEDVLEYPSIEVDECNLYSIIEEAEAEEERKIANINEEREKVAPFLSNFLDSKTYQKASTFYVYKKNVSLEDVCKQYDISLEELTRNNKEDFKEGDLINIPLRHE